MKMKCKIYYLYVHLADIAWKDISIFEMSAGAFIIIETYQNSLILMNGVAIYKVK